MAVAPAGTAADDRPLVVACLAPADLRPDVNPLSGEVWADSRRADLSAADAAALEHALRAGEAWSGRVLAVAAGPVRIDGVLLRARALGAEVLRVPWPPGSGHTAGEIAGEIAPDDGPAPLDGPGLAADPQALALALAGAISGFGQPALVICGDRSALRGTGAMPALLAHHLGAGQALGLVSLRVEADSVVVERRLDGGWRERLRVVAPAVCSVEAAGVRLRRAPLNAALGAAGAVVPVAAPPAAASAGAGASALRIGGPRPYRPRTRLVAAPTGGTQERLLTLTGALVAHDPPRLVGPIDADGAADELLTYLARHGYRA